MLADDIPVAHTPPGGFGGHFPEPVIAGCNEPLVATPIHVIASYDGQRLRPSTCWHPGIEVTRRLDDESHMIWTRPDLGGLVVTLERIGDGEGTSVNTLHRPR